MIKLPLMNSSHEFILKFLMLLNMIIITLIIFNKNISPLNLMMTLLIFTMIYLISIYLINQKPLYCLMILISMISGNMIMFLYFTSLINNYYNKSFKSMINSMLMIISLLLIMMLMYYLSPMLKIKYTYSPMIIYKIYNYPLCLSTLILILYLILTLLFSMKICLFKHKPLRKIIN
uniref:NADH dehydrogenase subunit 6 n=1 Tax=Lasioglossum malachurum TaxID=88512 RepID=A0A0S2LTA5_9HYME|nr:NADH dehydrogenase subunit 6 [Lasioglossum malachurum]